MDMVFYRSFDDTTLEDVEELVRQCFGKRLHKLLGRILSNPLRNLDCEDSAGDIAYESGEPRAFQAAIMRRMFLGRKEITGVVGSTLCIMPDASPEFLVDVCEKTMRHGGASIYFGNTTCKAAMRINKFIGGTVPNLQSYKVRNVLSPSRRAVFVWKLSRLISCVFRHIGINQSANTRKLFKNCKFVGGNYDVHIYTNIDRVAFDGFWARYYNGNKGLVCSRSSKELEWVHGDGLASGRRVIVGIEKCGALLGYCVLRAKDANRWQWDVVDWIAIGNDLVLLDIVLYESIRYMAKSGHAAKLFISGFCSPAQKIVQRYFSQETYPNGQPNYFCYKLLSSDLSANEDMLDTLESWFFGPYDGDECLL